jgi:hypothetical protein
VLFWKWKKNFSKILMSLIPCNLLRVINSWMILIHANCILISFSNGNYFRFPVQVVWNHEETMHIKGAALLEIVISKLEFFTKVKNHSNLDCMMSTWTILEYIYSKFLWYKYTPTPHSWRLVLLLHIFAM